VGSHSARRRPGGTEQATPLRRAWAVRGVAVTIETRGEWFTGEPQAAVLPVPRLTYHFLAAVDIEAFSGFDTLDQVILQSRLRDVLERAARQARLNRELWHVQVNGDGELAVLPGDIDGSQLVADYPRELARALTEANAEAGEGPRLRIRVALHHGAVVAGGHGPVGPAPIEVSRLLNLEALRRELRRRPNEDLVLIVSSALYRDVVESRLRGLDPADFFFVSEEVKGRAFPGHIYRGGGSPRRRADREPIRLRSTPKTPRLGRWRFGKRAS